MNQDPPINIELDALLLELLDGQWSDSQQAELEQLLSDNAEARSRYRQLMATHAMLETEHAGAARIPALSHVQETDSDPEPVTSIKHLKAYRRFAYLGWAVAAAILLATSAWLSHNQSAKQGQEPVATSDRSFAVITRVINPDWQLPENGLTTGDTLKSQWIQLRSGITQIDFSDGARLVLQGPARLRIDSPSACYVEYGKLTVLADQATSNFTVKSPGSQVVDMGTEFGVIVDRNGKLNVHVLDGEVEVSIRGAAEELIAKRRLVEKQAANIDPAKNQIQEVAFDPLSFEPIRARTLRDTQLLKLQFDCGSRAGLYQGTQSPAHISGDMLKSEEFWNPLLGDQSGRFLLADGSTCPYRIEIDYGGGKKEIDWSLESAPLLGPQGPTHGVFDTKLGRDNLNATGVVALRIRGLPKGKYRVYTLGRSSLDHHSWGNYLVSKAHLASVGTNLSSMSRQPSLMAPLSDPTAKKWVAGQTHVVTDVTITGPQQYLSIITTKDRDRSPQPKGGRAVILGIQIVQLGNP